MCRERLCPPYHGVTCRLLQTEEHKNTDGEGSANEKHFTPFLSAFFPLFFMQLVNNNFSDCTHVQLFQLSPFSNFSQLPLCFYLRRVNLNGPPLFHLYFNFVFSASSCFPSLFLYGYLLAPLQFLLQNWTPFWPSALA